MHCRTWQTSLILILTKSERIEWEMNKLKEARNKKGLTQYELGKLIGKHQSRIWQIEKG